MVLSLCFFEMRLNKELGGKAKLWYDKWPRSMVGGIKSKQAYKVIAELYDVLLEALRRNELSLAYRYSHLIRDVLLRSRARRPSWLHFCKNCGIVLVPGLSATVRLRKKGRMRYIVVKCALCGYIHRYPYKM
ncbi:MAG: ribonuclease P [Pyrodictiaceae archaeon]